MILGRRWGAAAVGDGGYIEMGMIWWMGSMLDVGVDEAAAAYRRESTSVV